MKILLAVLGHELTLLSIPSFKTIRSCELTVPRVETGSLTPISHSPCGKYLALSYANNGEGKVEIRDAHTLDILYVLGGPQKGIPQSDMSWDTTGRYLACRFGIPQNKETLIVWDTKSQRSVLQEKANFQGVGAITVAF